MNAQTQKVWHPPNRDALAAVRSGASASDLGWAQGFYERICREQGVTPVPEKKPASVIAVVSVEAKVETVDLSARQSVLQNLLRDKWRSNETREITFDFERKIGKVRKRCRAGRHTTNLLLLLSESYGERINGHHIAEATGVATASQTIFTTAARGLRNLLAGTPFDVDVKAGQHGGYLLVYAGTKDPARVKIISVGDVKLGGEK